MIESTRSSDVGDMASDMEQIARDAAIASRVQYRGVSPLHCDDCGLDIEEKRRLAVPGVRLCHSCATIKEQRGKRQ